MIRSLLGRASVVVAAAAMAACSGGSGAGEDVSQTQSAALSEGAPPYLALGDSIAFGDDGYISWTDPSRANAANFVGYPFEVAKTLYGSTSQVYDLACPGETTGSFLSATAADNGCREYKGENPLHESYAGTQMAAALAYLAANPRTRLVTLTLGGNDLLLAEYACDAASNFDECVVEAIPGVVATATANVAAIVGGLRGAGYSGDIVYLTQYATSYTDVTQLAAIPLFNTAVGAAVIANGGKVASGFDTFAAASVLHDGDPCTAGLLIPNPDGTATCDKHPSVKGRNLLADAVLLVP
jgi:predicted small secreted protein/lysophospholipase L1-like esterase